MRKIKAHDSVMVIAGKYKGQIGTVLKVLPDEDSVIVSNVNVVTRHKKPYGSDPGGKVKKTLPIHISNLSLYYVDKDHKTAPTKVKIVEENGKLRRALKKTNAIVEEYDYGSNR